MSGSELRGVLALIAALAAAGLAPGAASAHNGVVHKNAAEAAAHRAAEGASATQGDGASSASSAPKAPGLPVTPDALFPKGVGGPYELIDQFGRARDQRDPDGRPQLVFFGYATCEAICSVAMPRVAEAVRLLEREAILATPVLITVDPGNDTPSAMRKSLPKTHPRYVGLTGSEAALAAARKAFQVEAKKVSETRDGAPIYAHGSFIYLMDGDGEFMTLMPPVLSAERMAEIVKGYLSADKAG